MAELNIPKYLTAIGAAKIKQAQDEFAKLLLEFWG